MPSKKSFEEESNTTLRRKATDLAKAKWSTKVKLWVGAVGGTVPIILLLVAAINWLNTNLAWAAEVQKSYVLQTIDVNQLRTEDRMWKVKHDLTRIAERKEAGTPLITDELDRAQLLSEYTFLLEQKQKWNDAEKQANK